MTRFGVVLVGTVSLAAAAVTVRVLAWRGHTRAEVTARETEREPAAPEPSPPAPAAVAAGRGEAAHGLADRLVDGPNEATERALLALGDAAVAALIQRLDRGGVGGAARERLIGLLRQLPGPAAESRLALEARNGPQASTRTMAIDALAERKTERAFETLGTIARSDPHLPANPLIAQPRDPNDPSTELPDEQIFTPRMQAMAALAETRDARAVAVLTDVVHAGPDEALRMEAARHLGTLRDQPGVAEVLRVAAASDPSAYVRLSALHGLNGSSDPALPALLARIVAQDRDAGVRTLAQQVLASLQH